MFTLLRCMVSKLSLVLLVIYAVIFMESSKLSFKR